MSLRRWLDRRISIVLMLALFVYPSLAQQATASLRGQITDELGGAIVGARVTLSNGGGFEKSATTDGEGIFVFNSLTPGMYVVRVSANGFAPYENATVKFLTGLRERLNIRLRASIEEQKMTVNAVNALGVELDNNRDAIVLRGNDLDALPDDPAELAAALHALAGPAAGPNGGQIFIDGFTGGRLPPKESIREIRINQDPFSAEHDRLGYGRIEVLTKPGTDRFHGSASYNFNDEVLNSRNPFAPDRAQYQSRLFGGNVSGPLARNRSSFFVDFERREIDDNDIINAVILDSALSPLPFSQVVLTPRRLTSFGPRLDYQISRNHTLVARYSYNRSTLESAGVGAFSLLSRAYDTLETEGTLRLTETAILSSRVINETRFQYRRTRQTERGDNSTPTIRVLDSFTGGGSRVGLSLESGDQWELHNYTSWTQGRHTFKAGGRLRGVSYAETTNANFGGTFVFTGGLAPKLDKVDRPVLDADGQPVLVPITSIERYRRTLLFQRQGLTPAALRILGGGPSQFSITFGEPMARVSQLELGAFAQDYWRLRRDFMLALGLRYQTQSNIRDSLKFAPRIAFAWSPAAAGARQPKTVIRGGFGIFYDRLSESFMLQTRRFNGINQRQFIVSDPDFFPTVPSAEELTPAQLPTIRRISVDLQPPNTIQSAIGVERVLPLNTTVTATFINTRAPHALLSRNINAPRPGASASGELGARPISGKGNIFEYESSGIFRQNQLIITINNRLNRSLTLFATYVLNKANSDTDGAGTFPADSYNLSAEYGRSALDVRHRFVLGGTVNAPWGVRLNPLITAQSGSPFNITTGRDANGDTLFTERPAFAIDSTKPGVVITRFGSLDPNPVPGHRIIPRNFAEGPGLFSVSLRLSKTLSFGIRPALKASPDQLQGGSGGSSSSNTGRTPINDPFSARRASSSSRAEERFSLRFSVQVQNLFNRTNAGTPIGNLSSSFFGRSNSPAGSFGSDGGGNPAAGNRRVEAQIRFSF